MRFHSALSILALLIRFDTASAGENRTAGPGRPGALPVGESGFAPLADMEALGLFNRASEFYQKASELPPAQGEESVRLYRQAAQSFEEILARGFVHPDVYYNLGNTYFKLNQIGRAVLNYRRAQRFLPSDPDLLENIRSAKSKTLDTEPDRSPPELLRNLLFWHYDTSLDMLACATLVAYLTLCVGFCVSVFWRKPVMRTLNLLTALLFVLLGVSFFVRSYQDRTTVVAVVLAEVAPVLTGYGEHETERFTVHQGTELLVEEIHEDSSGARWLKVSLSPELRGWIRADALELIR
ncbi:MAG: hypothetical protein HYU36_04590 [Planctomycetes bacterium]|nr:hypothetical protein [Planctomycetota bacterium]